MSDDCQRVVCKLLAILVVLWVSTACGTDKGSSGDIPPENVFVDVEGCLADNPDPGETGTIFYSFNAPFDDSLLLEARLEVLRGGMDLVLGTENPPSDYFAFGRGAGVQKILVGPDSREPMQGRPWFVQLDSVAYEIQPLVTSAEKEEGCRNSGEPDWRLSVRRSSGIEGRVVLDQEGEVPAYGSDSIQIEVPEDALSMEIVLKSLKREELEEEGDADLLVGLGAETESLVSLNPGPGYDVVAVDPGRLVPLRGQAVGIRLESRQQPTAYRLEAAYIPGEPEEEAP